MIENCLKWYSAQVSLILRECRGRNGCILEKGLVSRNYRDSADSIVPTHSTTISRWAKRLALCFSAVHPERDSNTRDINQAYVQSEETFSREVYLVPPAEMDLAEISQPEKMCSEEATTN